MKIKERLIQVSRGKVYTETELKIGDEIMFSAQCEVVKIEHTANQDGTMNETYVVKPVIGEVLNREVKDTDITSLIEDYVR